MIEQVLKNIERQFVWIDVNDPQKKELTQLAKEHGLPTHMVKDCLQPEHLPKFERAGPVQFIILRAFDQKSSEESDSVRELTRKVAVFMTDQSIITVHRKALPFITQIKEEWAIKAQEATQAFLVFDILGGVIKTYQSPIETAFDELEKLEDGVVDSSALKTEVVRAAYLMKRKASAIRRMIRLSNDVFQKVGPSVFENNSSLAQDIRERIDNLYFYADQLLDDTTGLLNLHISLSSQRTNEVMRILTVFSLFFLPLNFIASIYGMNFEFMPELHWIGGYPVVLLSMAGIALGIYFWFRRRGWI